MRERIKNLVPKPLKEIYKKFRYGSITFLFYLFRMLPIKNNLVVCMNVWGFGDNSRYVASALSKRKQPMEIVFICNHPPYGKAKSKITFLKTNSIRAIYSMAVAHVWVACHRMEPYIRKRENQYYIQLWHGGLALKKIEGDCTAYLGDSYVNNAKRDSAMTDLYISNGEFCTKMYRRAFWFQKEVIECGSPRMDLLFHISNTKKEQIRTRLGIKAKEKIVLYGPTYRDTNDYEVYRLNLNMVCKTLEQLYGEPFKAVVRLHPLVSAASKHLGYSQQVIDASHNHDMYELLAICDVLITDYSNIMFEAAYVQKPVFLYAKDFDCYQQQRGFYFDYKELPFPKAYNEQQLIAQMESYGIKEYQEKQKLFFETQGIMESGNASEIVADKIVEVVLETSHKKNP